MLKYLLLILAIYSLSIQRVLAQSVVQTNNQLWLGYMSNTTINGKHSLWNDVHYVPNGFFIIRTGITKQYNWVNATIGYAYGKLPNASNKDKLQRNEHRPWAQVQASIIMPRKWIFIPRIRYDARLRQETINGVLNNSYSFVHRFRIMTSFRKSITKNPIKIGSPYIAFSNEVLLNVGQSTTTQSFDQNRFSIMVGTVQKNIQIQVGYMNRYVKASDNLFTKNNTLVLWVTHRLTLKKTTNSSNLIQDGE